MADALRLETPAKLPVEQAPQPAKHPRQPVPSGDFRRAAAAEGEATTKVVAL